MSESIEYATPGPLTGLEEVAADVLEPVGVTPLAICSLVHSLVVHPTDTPSLDLPESRFAENGLRPAARIIDALLALDPSPVTVPREPRQRVVGTCRHFALVSCALLRYRSIPSRVRCGFATYFQPDQGLDHWITEYWDDVEARWIRIDSEVLSTRIECNARDLRPDEFLSGGEAWTAYRRGEIDASTYGVYGSENWGPAEIRGNVVKDLAALAKVEMLPWDEWGQMSAAYRGETDEEYDDLLDTVAAVCAADDGSAIAALYAHQDLRVPDSLIV